MPRTKITKQKKETRREKQNKEAKQNDNKSIKTDAVSENLNSGRNAVVKQIGNKLIGPQITSTDNKSAGTDSDSDDQNAGRQAVVRKYRRIGCRLVGPLTLLADKYESIYNTASPDERLEAFYEEKEVMLRIILDYQQLDSIAQIACTTAIQKILSYAEDIGITEERINRLKNKRVPFQKAIDYYEATLKPRPDFKILSISFDKDSSTPTVECSEEIPKKELRYRLRQYQAYFYNQYYLHCAPLDKEKRHKSLQDLWPEMNTDTREIPRQMQMPLDEGYRANYESYCKIFLESVIRKSGYDSKCTKLISVLPPLNRKQWPRDTPYRRIKCYDIYGGKRHKNWYDERKTENECC